MNQPPELSPFDFAPVYRKLKQEYRKHRMPVVDLIQLQTNDPFKVLVSTILSSRTKDQTTIEAATRLFAEVPSLDALEKLTEERIAKLIFPVGFYRNKARFLTELPGAVKQLFNGQIPQTVEDLVRLPGVGRKTANLVVAVGFQKPGLCVDVHVHRITNRLGYVRTKTPLETEMALRRILPSRYWITFNSIVVSYGQHLCTPRNPRCDTCSIAEYCRRVGVVTRYPPRT